MTGLRCCFLPPPCGTWSAFFAVVAPRPVTENISMIECFGISSKVAELARPMFRRQKTEERELPVPSSRPDWHSDRHRKPVIVSSSLVAVPISGGIGESFRCWTRQGVHKPTAKPARQTTDAAGAELLDPDRLFARLVFQQIRPRNRSAADAGAQSGSSYEPQSGRVPIPAPDVRSRIRRSRWPVALAQAASPDPLPASIETLFIELARRRLRSFAAKGRPA
jgi:hypothetical protein